MALENIEKRAKQEKDGLEEGIQASIKELENGRLSIPYNGKEFEFPKEQPAWVLPFMQLYGEGPDKELSDMKALEFMVKLMGKELAEELVDVADNHFGMSDLAEQILVPIREKWEEQKPEAEKK